MNLKTLSAKLNNAFDILSDSGITIIPAGMTRCPRCAGDGEGISVPAVTVGEPQPEEYPPCGRCKGRGWVVVDTETESEEESCQS